MLFICDVSQCWIPTARHQEVTVVTVHRELTELHRLADNRDVGPVGGHNESLAVMNILRRLLLLITILLRG